MAAASGDFGLLFPENGSLDLAFALLFATFATMWANRDAKSRGITMLSIVLVLYILCWPIGAWIYLLHGSGPYGLVHASIHTAGVIATCVLAGFGTFFGLL